MGNWTTTPQYSMFQLELSEVCFLEASIDDTVEINQFTQSEIEHVILR